MKKTTNLLCLDESKQNIFTQEDLFHVLDANYNSPIEKELHYLIGIWKKEKYTSEEILKIENFCKQRIDELLEMSNELENKDDISAFESLKKEIKDSESHDIGNVLLSEINGLYNKIPAKLQNLIYEIKSNQHYNGGKLLVLAIIILLSKTGFINENETDNQSKSNKQDSCDAKIELQQAQWINNSINKVISIYDKIEAINTNLKSNSFTEVFIKELKMMTCEMFASLTATGCHIFKEDCSVILWPIEVKPQQFSNKQAIKNFKSNSDNIFSKYITSIFDYLDQLKQLNGDDYFLTTREYLLQEANQDLLRNNFYLVVPVIVDAYDIYLYLKFIDQYLNKLLIFISKKQSNNFRISVTGFHEKNENNSLKQPRIKLQDFETDFNIRLDYNRINKSIEMDIGGIGFILENGENLMQALKENENKAIVSNSYKLGSNSDTNRIMKNSKLSIQEQVSLIHSVLMTQGCSILGRNKKKMFGYHYTLKEKESENDFQQAIKAFNCF